MKNTVKVVMVLGVLIIWVGLVLGQNSAPVSQFSPADAKAKIIKVLASNAKKRITMPYIVKCFVDMTNQENPPSKVIPEMLQGLSQSKYVSQNKVTLKLFTNAKREDALNFLAEIMVANSIDPEPILAKLNFHAIFLYKGYMQRGLVSLSIPEQRTELTNFLGTGLDYTWAQFDQLIDEKAPIQPKAEPTQSGVEYYMDFFALTAVFVDMGLDQYFQELNKKAEENNGKLPEIATDYVISYFFSSEPKDCPYCRTDLENMLEKILYDSKLAKEGKLSLILLTTSKQQPARDQITTALARIFFRRGGFEKGSLPKPEEVKAVLERVNFQFRPEVSFTVVGIAKEFKNKPKSKIFPLVVVCGPSSSGNFEDRKGIYVSVGKKVIWSKIDQIILAQTQKH